jgi:hypothetical protein
MSMHIEEPSELDVEQQIAGAPVTPAAKWRVMGEPDPHGVRYDCARAQLAMGNLSDDELANGVFLHGDGTHGRPSLQDIIAGRAFSPIAWLTAAKDRIRWLSRALERARRTETLQQRVEPWLLACFGAEIAADTVERNHRFLEEALELVQACGCTASEAHQLVDYTFGRPVGEKRQEAGGVMITLAALCRAQGIDMHEAGEVELARIWTMVDKIRAKQAAKPKHSPLPGPTTVEG